MDGLYTVRQSLEKSLSPPTRSVRGGFLIRLLVGFREEAHVQVIRCRIFTHRDPFRHGLLQNPKSNGIVTREILRSFWEGNGHKKAQEITKYQKGKHSFCEFCAFLWLFPFGVVRSEQSGLGRLVGNA